MKLGPLKLAIICIRSIVIKESVNEDELIITFYVQWRHNDLLKNQDDINIILRPRFERSSASMYSMYSMILNQQSFDWYNKIID